MVFAAVRPDMHPVCRRRHLRATALIGGPVPSRAIRCRAAEDFTDLLISQVGGRSNGADPASWNRQQSAAGLGTPSCWGCSVCEFSRAMPSNWELNLALGVVRQLLEWAVLSQAILRGLSCRTAT